MSRRSDEYMRGVPMKPYDLIREGLIALGIVGAWILVGAVWLVVNSASTRTSLLVKPQIVSPER